MVIPVLIIHGGAGRIPAFRAKPKLDGLRKVVQKAYKLFLSGATLIDVVEKAVSLMEDIPAFNAGVGSMLTESGGVEMDAVIIDGRTMRSGAVSCISNVAHPIQVARLVMDRTDHCLLTGEGANKFAAEMGFPSIDTSSLITEYTQRTLEAVQKGADPTTEVGFVIEEEHGTVGAIIIDSEGHMAAATSTGGKAGQMDGRVGDSPVVGAGTYCDDNVGGVAVTGDGESMMRVCLAKHVTHLMEQGKSPTEASKIALTYMTQRVGGEGGIIALNNKGEVGIYFNSTRMAWSYVKGDTMYYGIDHDQIMEERI